MSSEMPTALTRRYNSTAHFGLAVIGDPELLKAAYDTDAPVTIEGTGNCAGEKVHIKLSRQGVNNEDETVTKHYGFDHELTIENGPLAGQTAAVYLIDMDRLDAAPRIKAAHQDARHKADARRAAEAEKLRRADQAYLEGEGDLKW